MNLLHSIQNLLQFLNDNWASITIIIGLSISLTRNVKDYLEKSNDEKIAIAKSQIHETVLKMITDAEEYYDEYKKSGSIKRSQVIGEIFNNYPILSKVVDQEELIKWIDNEIDNALITLRKVIEENKILEEKA